MLRCLGFLFEIATFTNLFVPFSFLFFLLSFSTYLLPALLQLMPVDSLWVAPTKGNTTPF